MKPKQGHCQPKYQLCILVTSVQVTAKRTGTQGYTRPRLNPYSDLELNPNPKLYP